MNELPEDFQTKLTYALVFRGTLNEIEDLKKIISPKISTKENNGLKLIYHKLSPSKLIILDENHTKSEDTHIHKTKNHGGVLH